MQPFDRIVVEHGPMVLRLCRGRLGPVAGDDAWSETFLSAMRAYPRLDESADVAAWLATIAHRKVIDHHRRSSRAAVPVDPTVLDRPAPADAQPIDDRLVWALAQLSDRQRNAVLYHHVVGLPHALVAELLGGSPAAVRRSAADGIAALRRLYLDQEDS